MRNANYRIPALLCGLLLACITAAAADSKKKTTAPPLPTTPMPTDRELGFFGNTRDEMLGSIKRIGIITPWLPYYMDDRDDAKLAVQEAVSKYLRLAGMEVVGPETFKAAYDRFNQQMGGIFDPKTGELRDEAANAVYQNARREFVSKERLDGYAVVRVQRRAAHYRSFFANWDGVRETSHGKPPPNGFVEIMGASDYSGTMPALSVTVQIANKQDRIVYGNAGGIQTTSYFDLTKGVGYQFIDVANKDLLRDEVRIDRAAKVATLPLIRTPREIWLGDDNPEINAEKIDLKTYPPLPPAAPRRAPSPLLVPRDQILANVHRVALSPINVGEYQVPEDVQKRLMDLLRQELAPLNWEIVDSPQARDALRAKILEGDLYDPLTGKRDEERAAAIRKSVFPLLSSGAPPDAVMWIALLQTSALHQQGDVEWDGVNQSGFTMGPVVKKTALFFGGSANLQAGTGSIKAITLSVYMADRNDIALYQGRGGLQLAQKLKFTPAAYGSYGPNDTDAIDLAPGELFRDPSREQPSVHAALRELVLTPEALTAELHPDPKKKAKK